MSPRVEQIILLKRVGFSLVSESGMQVLTYPEGVIRFEEITDGGQFTALTTEFLSKNGVLGKRTVIVLAEELVFKKYIPRSENDKTEVQYKDFLAEIPFDEAKLAKLKIYEPDRLLAAAVNAEVYKRLKKIIEDGHGRVEAVTPAFALGENFNEATPEIIQILKEINRAGMQKYNFLNEKEAVSLWLKITPNKTAGTVQRTDGSGQKLKVVAALLVTLVLLAAAIFGLLKYRNLSTELPVINEPIAEITVMPEAGPPATTSAIPVSSPTPPVTVTKAELKVRVFNGSGISGQAGLVKNKLEELGFQKVETGNIEMASGSKTTAEFGSRVEQPVINEVLAALSANLNGAITEATRSGEIDILITTR